MCFETSNHYRVHIFEAVVSPIYSVALRNLCECIFRSLVVNCVVYKWLCVRTGAVLPLSNVVLFSSLKKIILLDKQLPV